jgi:hypothetical protein
MALHRWTLLAAVTVAAALPATASAALTKVADPINVAPDAEAASLQQSQPGVAMARDGSFAVAYLEAGVPLRAWVQRFSPGRDKVGARIALGAAGAETREPAIAMAPDGRFAAAYQTSSAPSTHIEIQRFTAAGVPDGAPILPDGINTNQPGPVTALAMADDGRLAVAWLGSDGGGVLRLRTYAADGSPSTAATDVLPLASYSLVHPSIGMAGDGHFVLAYWAADGTITGRRFAGDGTPSGPTTSLYTSSPAGEVLRSPAIGMGDDGSAFVAFTGPYPASGPGGVLGRRIDAAGTPLGDRFVPTDKVAGQNFAPDVAVDDDGDVLLAYDSQIGGQELSYLTHLDAAGNRDGADALVGMAQSGNLQEPQVASDGQGRAVFAYTVRDTSTLTAEVMVARWNYGAAPDDDAPPADPGPSDPPAGGGAPPAPVAPAPAVVAPPFVPPVVKPKPKPAAATVTVAKLVTFPAGQTCASRRSFAIRLRVPKGANVVQATVKVNGKKVAVRRGTRLRSTVDLRKLPKGKFTVSIELKLATGKVVKGSRTYRTCVAKQKGGKPKV